MMTYFVDFIAHIDERKRPENFPRQVHDKQVLEVESMSHLQILVNEKFIKMVSSAGLVVLKDESAIVDDNKLFSQRMFVPWHLITYMVLDVKLMSNTNLQELVPSHPNLEKPKEIVN